MSVFAQGMSGVCNSIEQSHMLHINMLFNANTDQIFNFIKDLEYFKA